MPASPIVLKNYLPGLNLNPGRCESSASQPRTGPSGSSPNHQDRLWNKHNSVCLLTQERKREKKIAQTLNRFQEQETDTCIVKNSYIIQQTVHTSTKYIGEETGRPK